MARLKTHNLTTKLKLKRFSGSSEEDLSDLLAALRAQDVARPVKIKAPEDILLSSSGMIQGRYRFTDRGMQELCAALGPGLSDLISGLTKSGAEEDQAARELAVRVVNSMTRLRFENLKNKSLLIDPVTKTIDGVVGARYEIFSSLSAWNTAVHIAANNSSSSTKLYECLLQGRKCSIRYRSRTPLFNLRLPGGPVNFYTGFCISNIENGSAALEASVSIMDDQGNTALSPVARVCHCRHEIAERIAVVRHAVSVSHSDMVSGSELRDLFIGLQRSLGLTSNPDELEQSSRRLSRWLARHTGKVTADEIVDLTITRANSAVAIPDGCGTGLSDRIQSRTVYDLYCAVTSKARKHSIESRERLEVLAFYILRRHLMPPSTN